MKDRVCFLALYVSDLETSGRFYRDAIGLPLHVSRDGTHEECSWRDPYLHFAVFQAEPDTGTSFRSNIGFAVDDLAARHEQAVAAGAKVVEEPAAHPWGSTAVYEDPDGNHISLNQLKS